jgi:mannitol/fructose-specific phosphotransferase system IIA component|tara:strand:+ start:342 stop:536 length:195 start_codon:yes stop_codon:yes gene_type:complete
MSQEISIPIVTNDYKSAVTSKKVSVRVLRDQLDYLEAEIKRMSTLIESANRELRAIIEEIGEEW